MNDLLRSKTIANLSFNTLAKLLTFTIGSVSGIILARRLSAEDYGIVGFAMIFISFLSHFSDLGITSSVIRKEHVEEGELFTAFMLKLLLGLLILGVSFLWGMVGQMALENPAVKMVIIVLSSTIVINCLGFLPTITLKRELQFKRLTIPQIGSQVIASTVAIAAVYLGFRYWSIVLANVVSTLSAVAIAWMVRPVPFRIEWDLKSARAHLTFGKYIFFAGLMYFALFNADNFLIGAVRGAATLGFYAVAFNWSTKATSFIGDSINDVLFSTFSRIQNEAERLKRGYLKALEYVSFAVVLANSLIVALSRELLIIVLGGGTNKWIPALYALDVLCVYGAVRALNEPLERVVIAIGKPDLLFKANALATGIQLTALYPAIKYFGIVGAALVVTVSYSIQFLVYFHVLHREIELSLPEVLRTILPAILSGCVLEALGLGIGHLINISWLSLAVKLCIGTSAFLITYGLLTRWKILKEGLEIFGLSQTRATRSPI